MSNSINYHLTYPNNCLVSPDLWRDPDLLTPALAQSCDIVSTPYPNTTISNLFVPDYSGTVAQMAYQGFSVSQPRLGEALQWLPALGTQELDDLINAYLPGQSSLKDKRAHISMDFFEYSRITGETFKFYPVPAASYASTTAPSPASSAAFYDSGYGSGFNTSPVFSDMSSWTQSPAPVTPTSFQETRTKQRTSTSSKKSTASSARQITTTDFSNHPGMRIMTKDGQDVTNSASRGCKTKEQRDHAHLMRIIKACDACKRKKIRCDPSHKKRSASSTSPTQPEAKPTKKLKKSTDPPPPEIASQSTTPALTPAAAFETPEMLAPLPSFDENVASTNVDDLFNEYMLFDQEQLAAVDNLFPVDYDFVRDPQGFFSFSSGSDSASPSQVLTPYTPAPAGLSPLVFTGTEDVVSTNSTATVPYLNPGVPHGTDYVDFNLFSPASDFALDEPLVEAKGSLPGGDQYYELGGSDLGQQLYQQQPSVAGGDLVQYDGFLADTSPLSSSQRSFAVYDYVTDHNHHSSPGTGPLIQSSYGPQLAVPGDIDDRDIRATQLVASDAKKKSKRKSKIAKRADETLATNTRLGYDEGTGGLEPVSIASSDRVTTVSSAVISDRYEQGYTSQPTATPLCYSDLHNCSQGCEQGCEQQCYERQSVQTAVGRSSPQVPVLQSPAETIQYLTSSGGQLAAPAESARPNAPGGYFVNRHNHGGLGASVSSSSSSSSSASLGGSEPQASVMAASAQKHAPRSEYCSKRSNLGEPHLSVVRDASVSSPQETTTIVSTLPMRQIVAGECTVNGLVSFITLFSQLVVFGLVSCLLASISTHSPSSDSPSVLPSILAIISISATSLWQQQYGLNFSKSISVLPNSVESKIHRTLCGFKKLLQGLDCSVVPQRRTTPSSPLPRLVSRRSVMI